MNDHADAKRIEVPEARHAVAEGAEAERSAFALHRDPSLAPSGDQPRLGRGIAWVRPSDLIASSSARIAGRGIDFQTELAHRVRRAPRETFRATRNRARDLHARHVDHGAPERSSFDVFEVQEHPRSTSWVRPSGIGLG